MKNITKMIAIASLFFTSFFGVNIVAAEESEASTQITVDSIEFDKQSITKNDSVTVAITLSGDISKLTRIQLSLRNDIFDSKYIHFSKTISSKDKSNIIYITQKINEYLPDGNWNFSFLSLTVDGISNYLYENTLGMSLRNEVYLHTNNMNVDVTPPVIIDFRANKDILKTGETIEFEVLSEDDNSGISYVTISLLNFNDASTSDQISRDFRINTKRVDGVYKGTFTPNSETLEGLWYVQYVYVRDMAGNSRFVYSHDDVNIGSVQFDVYHNEFKQPIEKYVINESQRLDNIVIDGDLYIGPNAVANITSRVVVKGDVFVLGAMYITNNLKIEGTLYATRIIYSYGSTPLYNGSVHFRSGSHSIPSTVTTNRLFEVPHRLDNLDDNVLSAVDGVLSITGEYLPIVDLFIDEKLIDIEKSGEIFASFEVSKQNKIELEFIDVLNRKYTKVFAINHVSDNPNAKYNESIYFVDQEFVLNVNESKSPQYTLSPNDTFNRNVQWESSNPNVAYVDANGQVTGKSKGSAIITVTSVEGSKTDSILVNVQQQVIGITLDESKFDLAIGESKVVTPIIIPDNANNQTVIWESLDENIAVVDDVGNVTGVSAGMATIRVRTVDGNYEATLNVNVIKVASDIILNTDNIVINYGDTFEIEAKIYPEDTSLTSLTWASSNPNVATVNEYGVITGIQKGNTIITVTSEDSKVTKYINVYVKIPVVNITPNKYYLEMNVGNYEYISTTIFPSNADFVTLTWTSSDRNIVEVDNYGNIYAKNHGSAEIKISTDDGEAETIVSVYVTKPVSGIHFKQSNQLIFLRKGYGYQLEANVLPYDAHNQGLVWQSYNTNVVKINQNGYLYSVGSGYADVCVFTEELHMSACIYVYSNIYNDGWNYVGYNWYYLKNGYKQTDWIKSSNKWYYMNEEGKMQTGWLKLSNKWYYTNYNGAMQTGWLKLSNKWYYMKSNGVMQTGWNRVSNNWYYMNTNGVMQTGWNKVANNWYYMNTNGEMMTGWVKVSNKWYYLDSSGAMQTGWVKASSKWYYMDSSGVMQTGWLKLQEDWYYLKSDGSMATGNQLIGNKIYKFGGGGIWLH